LKIILAIEVLKYSVTLFQQLQLSMASIFWLRKEFFAKAVNDAMINFRRYS